MPANEILVHHQRAGERSYVKMLRSEGEILLDALSDGYPDEEDTTWSGSITEEEFEKAVAQCRATGKGNVERGGEEIFSINNRSQPNICFKGLHWSYNFTLSVEEMARILA